MTPFEALALAYFTAVAAIGGRGRSRLRGGLYAAGAMALIIVARWLLPWGGRAWMPHAYLLLGYWVPAAFTPTPVGDRFERWLTRIDSRLGAGGWVGRSRLLEAAYLLCFPFVPAAFAVVFFSGDARDVTRFWIAVLAAGFACYGTLRWTAARPPRLAAGSGEEAPRGVAKLNATVLGRLSHHLNTFPSGHVAVSFAAGLSVASVHAVAGGAFLLLASAIAVAAVAGRYHYLIDVLTGVLVGALAWLTRFL